MPALPTKRSRLDSFISLIVSGRDIKDAARSSGYAAESGYNLMRQPRVAEAIARQLAVVAAGELGPKALNVIRIILDSETASERTKLDAAKTLLDRIGVVAPKDAGNAPEDDVDAMSRDQLEDKIRELQDKIADQAKPVKAQELDHEDAHDIEMFK
jgi:hypothetical protein